MRAFPSLTWELDVGMALRSNAARNIVTHTCAGPHCLVVPTATALLLLPSAGPSLNVQFGFLRGPERCISLVNLTQLRLNTESSFSSEDQDSFKIIKGLTLQFVGVFIQNNKSVVLINFTLFLFYLNVSFYLFTTNQQTSHSDVLNL